MRLQSEELTALAIHFSPLVSRIARSIIADYVWSVYCRNCSWTSERTARCQVLISESTKVSGIWNSS